MTTTSSEPNGWNLKITNIKRRKGPEGPKVSSNQSIQRREIATFYLIKITACYEYVFLQCIKEMMDEFTNTIYDHF